VKVAVTVGLGVRVGGIGVTVGGMGVEVGGSGVAVGGTGLGVGAIVGVAAGWQAARANIAKAHIRKRENRLERIKWNIKASRG
jgi:hypothetical protein